MEWFRRLCVAVAFERGVLADGGPAAFFLTAHFSQEDYPYDW